MTVIVTKSAMKINRYFAEGLDSEQVLQEMTWEDRDARITGANGEVIFEQKDTRFPKNWSITASNIVASKYFYGKQGSPVRETTAGDLVRRVVNAIAKSGMEQGYFDEENAARFRAELTFLLINQYAAFNSPVWFNVGVDSLAPDARSSSWHWTDIKNAPGRPGISYGTTGYKNPQCSACFINSVEDSMEGIMKLATTEAMLFKWGSGTGTNFSTLRSSKEGVSGGGQASGPLSFMKGFDAFAGVIKSGGKTRRAAKMAILNIHHPDIVDFIDCKIKEDKKAKALMAAGYDGTSGPDSEAYSSVFYQNANNSVRVTDQFMKCVETDSEYRTFSVKDPNQVVDTYQAADLFRKIAQAAWECGDPGLQFDDTINKWHTSKASGRINASNPCSEYMFLDNSACNLSSFNLLQFLDEKGIFDVKAFSAAVHIMIIAQDILVDLSGYPTGEIARNSHNFRPLGLGYANLGALLMALGLAYDSDEGRAYAAAITAIMTGQAYVTSATLAKNLAPLEPAGSMFNSPSIKGGLANGACPGWFRNKESFLDVIGMHADAVEPLRDTGVPEYLFDFAYTIWLTALEAGREFGYRNSQVTVLAPTGTIGFMMDCDTTGIEPELSLIKFKKMVGGGQIKIVNETVERALRTLGYGDEQIEDYKNYIDKHGSLEGSLLESGDLPVFDTAFRPQNGTRSIHYMGHIKMMAAVQPFLSGAISKTVNLPAEATVEDIEDAYMQAWRLGLKSVAVYRDGSKSNQPMVTKKEETPTTIMTGRFSGETSALPKTGIAAALMHGMPAEASANAQAVKDILDNISVYRKNGKTSLQTQTFEQTLKELVEGDDLNAPPKAVRHRLPDTRPAVTHKFSIAGHEGYLTVGLYENGQPGELFIAMAKEGSTISGFMDSFAVVFSISLQHGVPLATLVSKLAHTRFEPSGWTGDPEIGYAKSIMDYVARWLEGRFLKPKQGKLFAVEPDVAGPATAVAFTPVDTLSSIMSMGDSPVCSGCGSIMVRSGSCYKCTECGESSGCS